MDRASFYFFTGEEHKFLKALVLIGVLKCYSFLGDNILEAKKFKEWIWVDYVLIMEFSFSLWKSDRHFENIFSFNIDVFDSNYNDSFHFK